MAKNLQKLRRFLPALVIRSALAVLTHVSPLNAGEVPHADRLADTSVSVVTLQISPARPARISAAGAVRVTSPTPSPA